MYYSHFRYHESLNNLLPTDVFTGHKQGKLKERAKVKKPSIEKRRNSYIYQMRTTQAPPANYQDPFYAYDHSNGCSITAGQFYNPTTANFSASYVGKYFFGDYCNGWIRTIDPSTKAVANFATGINRPLDVSVANDGTLYFIARGGISGGSDDANTSSTNGVV